MSTERGVGMAGSGVSKPGIERAALLSLITFSTLAGVCVWYVDKTLSWALGGSGENVMYASRIDGCQRASDGTQYLRILPWGVAV